MNNTTLKQLLLEYSLKRNKKITEAKAKKEKLYLKYPRLQEIDDELNHFAFSTAKSLLQNNNIEYLNNFKLKKDALLKEKQEIYSSLHIDSSYLKPKFECSICNDTGYITNNYKTTMCNCLKQKIFNIEYNKINTIDISKSTFDMFINKYYSPKANPNKYNSPISPRENIEIIKEIAKKFITNFNDPNEKNLLFTGNTGLGKTFLSNCIANELLKLNKTVMYQTAPIMIDSIINYRLRKKSKYFKYY